MDAYTLTLVFRYINSAKDYVAVTRTCAFWYRVIETVYPHGKPFVNELIALYTLYPAADWNYEEIANNPNITFNFASRIKSALSEVERPLFMLRVSRNMAITADDILNNPDFGWNIESIRWRRTVDIRLVRKYKYISERIEQLVENKQIAIGDIAADPEIQQTVSGYLYYYNSLENFIKYPKLPWDLDTYVGYKLGISRELLDHYIVNKYSETKMRLDILKREVGYHAFSTLGYAPIELVEKHIDRCDTGLMISKGSPITWDFIKQHPNTAFWFSGVIEHVARFYDDTVMHYVMEHTGPSFMFIYSNPVSQPNVEVMRHASKWAPIGFIIRHPDVYRWQWDVVMYRDDLSWDMIIEYELYKLANPSVNPNVTWRIVRDYPLISWDFKLLSKNTFGKRV